MSTDATQPQRGPERRRSLEISLASGRPPLDVPGYDFERFLGTGAYGEVWVALERNTGRRVAIKFYTHQGGLDWSLLAREVEKLAFLFADRHVVQLLGVGWSAEPPYYIMEYLERGSLADRIRQGPLSVAEAVAIFRSVAVGLVHAHGKGVLHCDLKPANILLDQDGHPRLADFGQSRLSTEQSPALGTLFYMAPEQANLTAVPEAHWDVYALGAVLYCMLTGSPPHRTTEAVEELERTEDLAKRLGLYRRMIRGAPAPLLHHRMRGVDRALAEIIDRCLAARPSERYPNVQAVLGALDARDARRARRPSMLLGAIGPALLLLVVTWFAWQGFSTAVRETDRALTARAYQTNRFVAGNLAELTGLELDRRFRALGYLANSIPLREAMAKAVGPESEATELLTKLADPALPDDQRRQLAKDFRENNPQRLALQAVFDERVGRHPIPETAGWFLTDALGNQIARSPEKPIIGHNFSWRTYFSGRRDDEAESWRPKPGEHVTRAHLSAVYQSQATDRWIVAISAPVYDLSPEPKFLGVAALMVEIGKFVDFQGEQPNQYATLIDDREGRNKGLILQHPRLERLLSERSDISEDDLRKFRVDLTTAPGGRGRLVDYVDPLGDIPVGQQDWLAEAAPVPLFDQPEPKDGGLVVVVQESYDGSIGSTLAALKASLLRYGVMALAVIAVVMIGLWTLAVRMFGQGAATRIAPPAEPSVDASDNAVTPESPTEPGGR
jgi:eukaryotic-like serine/threonine-protein kinase